MRIRRVALCLCLGLTPSLALTARAGPYVLLQNEGDSYQNSPVALNASGQSVGYSATSTGYDAVRWSSSGVPTLLEDVGGQGDSGAVAINASGWSVGSSQTTATGGQEAVLWTPSPLGTAIPLTDVGGQGFSGANAINASEQVVGYSQTAGGGQDAVLWSPGTTKVLQDKGGVGFSDAVAINTAGQSVGYSSSASGQEAVMWSPSGKATVLPNLTGVTGNYQAVAINDSGWIIGNSNSASTPGGQSAVLWTPSSATAIQLQDLPGGQGFSDVVAINASGWSVGYSEIPTEPNANFPSYEGVLWSPSGTPTPLQDPGSTGYAYAVAINDEEETVGYFEDADGPKAVEWSPNGDVMKELDDVLGNDWSHTFGVGINDLGQVVGLGEYTGDGQDGQYGFLIVPEPSTWALLIIGFAGLGFVGYRSASNRPAFATAT